MSAQATRPQHFASLWEFSGYLDADPGDGQRVVEVIEYATDEWGSERLRVRVLDRRDLFEPEVILVTPHQLFPLRELNA